MPKKRIKWIVLIAMLALLVAWGFYPLRYSREYSQIFRNEYANIYEQLAYLLEEDYALYAKDGERLCYCVLRENSSVPTIKRLGEYEQIKVREEDKIIDLLATKNEWLQEVELIYVSPDRIRFCAHMEIKMFVYQRKGFPFSFFREYGAWRLYRLSRRWYYAAFTAR